MIILSWFPCVKRGETQNIGLDWTVGDVDGCVIKHDTAFELGPSKITSWEIIVLLIQRHAYNKQIGSLSPGSQV